MMSNRDLLGNNVNILFRERLDDMQDARIRTVLTNGDPMERAETNIESSSDDEGSAALPTIHTAENDVNRQRPTTPTTSSILNTMQRRNEDRNHRFHNHLSQREYRLRNSGTMGDNANNTDISSGGRVHGAENEDNTTAYTETNLSEMCVDGDHGDVGGQATRSHRHHHDKEEIMDVVKCRMKQRRDKDTDSFSSQSSYQSSIGGGAGSVKSQLTISSNFDLLEFLYPQKEAAEYRHKKRHDNEIVPAANETKPITSTAKDKKKKSSKKINNINDDYNMHSRKEKHSSTPIKDRQQKNEKGGSSKDNRHRGNVNTHLDNDDEDGYDDLVDAALLKKLKAQKRSQKRLEASSACRPYRSNSQDSSARHYVESGDIGSVYMYCPKCRNYAKRLKHMKVALQEALRENEGLMRDAEQLLTRYEHLQNKDQLQLRQKDAEIESLTKSLNEAATVIDSLRRKKTKQNEKVFLLSKDLKAYRKQVNKLEDKLLKEEHTRLQLQRQLHEQAMIEQELELQRRSRKANASSRSHRKQKGGNSAVAKNMVVEDKIIDPSEPPRQQPQQPQGQQSEEAIDAANTSSNVGISNMSTAESHPDEKQEQVLHDEVSRDDDLEPVMVPKRDEEHLISQSEYAEKSTDEDNTEKFSRGDKLAQEEKRSITPQDDAGFLFGTSRDDCSIEKRTAKKQVDSLRRTWHGDAAERTRLGLDMLGVDVRSLFETIKRQQNLEAPPGVYRAASCDGCVDPARCDSLDRANCAGSLKPSGDASPVEESTRTGSVLKKKKKAQGHKKLKRSPSLSKTASQALAVAASPVESVATPSSSVASSRKPNSVVLSPPPLIKQQQSRPLLPHEKNRRQKKALAKMNFSDPLLHFQTDDENETDADVIETDHGCGNSTAGSTATGGPSSRSSSVMRIRKKMGGGRRLSLDIAVVHQDDDGNNDDENDTADYHCFYNEMVACDGSSSAVGRTDRTEGQTNSSYASGSQSISLLDALASNDGVYGGFSTGSSLSKSSRLGTPRNTTFHMSMPETTSDHVTKKKNHRIKHRPDKHRSVPLLKHQASSKKSSTLAFVATAHQADESKTSSKTTTSIATLSDAGTDSTSHPMHKVKHLFERKTSSLVATASIDGDDANKEEKSNFGPPSAPSSNGSMRTAALKKLLGGGGATATAGGEGTGSGGGGGLGKGFVTFSQNGNSKNVKAPSNISFPSDTNNNASDRLAAKKKWKAALQA